MNTRLQVEHPVSELLTGVDLACQQLLLAGGAALPGDRPRPAARPRDRVSHQLRGPRAATSAPPRARSPSCAPPLGPGVRFDTHAYPGYKVPPFYDSLLAKLIVWGADRAQALARARRALDELAIEGVTTTRELFLDVVHEPVFVSGRYTTAYLDDVRDALPSLGEGVAA